MSCVHKYVHYLQAVSLYKDPKGEKVLDSEAVPTINVQVHLHNKKTLSVKANCTGNSDQSTVTILQQNVTEPEVATKSEGSPLD